jgi:hypothetical protein
MLVVGKNNFGIIRGCGRLFASRSRDASRACRRGFRLWVLEKVQMPSNIVSQMASQIDA